jgi:hypothetical protein
MLREIDKEHLEEKGYRFSTYGHGNNTLLVIEGYELPPGYDPQAVDLLIEIPSTYPDGRLDMWWVYPDVRFAATGNAPPGTTEHMAYAGFTLDPARQWQRFSRHPEWRVGVDDLRTFLTAVRSTMERDVQQLAA